MGVLVSSNIGQGILEEFYPPMHLEIERQTWVWAVESVVAIELS